MPKLLILLLSIVLIKNNIKAQGEKVDKIFSPKFLEYLIINDLNHDALTWLDEFEKKNLKLFTQDSLYYLKSFLYIKINRLDSAHHYFKKIGTISNPAYIDLAFSLAISQKDTNTCNLYLKKLGDLLDENQQRNLQVVLKMFHRQKLDTSGYGLENEELGYIIEKYNSFEKKSTFKAILLSTFVPGWGKSYLGYKLQGLTTFVTNTVFALVMIEAIFKINNIMLSVATVSCFGIFYFGNILGTAMLAHKREVDFYNQINEDIANFYRNKLLY